MFHAGVCPFAEDMIAADAENAITRVKVIAKNAFLFPLLTDSFFDNFSLSNFPYGQRQRPKFLSLLLVQVEHQKKKYLFNIHNPNTLNRNRLKNYRSQPSFLQLLMNRIQGEGVVILDADNPLRAK